MAKKSKSSDDPVDSPQNNTQPNNYQQVKSRSKAASDQPNVPDGANQDPGWKFSESGVPASQQDQNQQPPPAQPVSWEASEYVARHKNAAWFMLALLAVIALSLIIFAITRDAVSTVTLGVVGLAFAGFAARPPRTIAYSVDNKGVHEGQKFYPYENFQSFSIFQDGGARSIFLLPVRRLGLPLVVHYDLSDEAQIVEVIGGHLPFEERELPAVDKLMTKIHF